VETLINFFALRPTFTVMGLKVVWYVYLLNTAVQVYIALAGITQLMAQRGISWEAAVPGLVPLFVGTISQLLIARLLIEVAAIVISSHNPRNT